MQLINEEVMKVAAEEATVPGNEESMVVESEEATEVNVQKEPTEQTEEKGALEESGQRDQKDPTDLRDLKEEIVLKDLVEKALVCSNSLLGCCNNFNSNISRVENGNGVPTTGAGRKRRGSEGSYSFVLILCLCHNTVGPANVPQLVDANFPPLPSMHGQASIGYTTGILFGSSRLY
jgi:hypothetical protein